MKKTRTDVSLECGGAKHTVSVIDGALVVHDHPDWRAEIDVDEIGKAFGDRQPLDPCLHVASSFVEGHAQQVPGPLNYLAQQAADRRANRRFHAHRSADFAYSSFTNAEEFTDSPRGYQLGATLVARAGEAFLGAQRHRFYRSPRKWLLDIEWRDRGSGGTFATGSANSGGLELKVMFDGGWLRDVARFGLAHPSVAVHALVIDTNFKKGVPVSGRAVVWRPLRGRSFHEVPETPLGMETRIIEVQITRTDTGWQVTDDEPKPPDWKRPSERAKARKPRKSRARR